MGRLTSLHIKNYKCFKDLELPIVGNVNLIAGKNNVGKTTLLEAVAIWASGGHPKELFRILDLREHPTTDAELRKSFLGLFPQLPCDISSDQMFPVRIHSPAIGPVGSWSALWQDFRRDAQSKLDPNFSISDSTRGFAYDLSLDAKKGFYAGLLDENQLVVGTMRKFSWVVDLDHNPLKVRKLWDGIVARPEEDLVVEALRLIEPSMARVVMPSDPGSSTPMVRLENQTDIVRISRYGDGMRKLFEIALVLAHSHGGILLIDEIENGLHHSVFPKLWKYLFEAARKLDVTVFATTHSYDAVEAFSKVALDDKESLGVLTRLDQRNGQIVAVQFTEEQAAFVIEERLEVR